MGRCHRAALANAATIVTIGLPLVAVALPWIIIHFFVPAVNLLGDLLGR